MLRYASLLGFGMLVLGCARGDGAPGVDDPGEPTAGACTPGQRSCQDGHATYCRPDGTLDQYDCDASQNLLCEPSGCTGECAHETLGASYMGCDYFPTVTTNPVWSGFDFAVSVANTKDVAATVRVTRGDQTIEERTVQPNAVEVIKLPWVQELKGSDFNPFGAMVDHSGPTRLVAGGAYRLKSDLPVTVYQYNSLEYSLPTQGNGCPPATDGSGGCYSYSNDTSLLLPVNALGRAYTAMSWFSMPADDKIDAAGFIAVTATADDTEVKLAGLGQFAPGDGIDAAGKGTVKLGAGDVLQIMAAPGVQPPAPLGSALKFGPDISGTQVFASKPVSVISGNRCGFVPSPGTGYCDHLEEAMFPTATLGRDYVVTAPLGPDNQAWLYVLRIAATEGPTVIHFDPPVTSDTMIEPGAPPLQIEGLSRDVHLTADYAVIVAQMLQGSTTQPAIKGKAPNEGDPSESLAVPTEQFRNAMIFSTSTTYDKNFANIIAPAGTSVTLDGKCWLVRTGRRSVQGAFRSRERRWPRRTRTASLRTRRSGWWCMAMGNTRAT